MVLGERIRFSPGPATRFMPALKITFADFDKWIVSASPGDALEYYRGFLAVDRLPFGSRLARKIVKNSTRLPPPHCRRRTPAAPTLCNDDTASTTTATSWFADI